MLNRPEPPDKRSDRTREQIMSAFTSLVFRKGFENVSVREVVETGGVARSTFYEHFSGKEEVLCACTERFFASAADCVLYDDPPPQLVAALGHLWGNRRLADGIFTGRAGVVLARHQADMLEKRLRAIGPGALPGAPLRLAATALAALQLEMIESWLRGQYYCELAELAATLHRMSRSAALSYSRPTE